jgi:hypothetical protein
MAKLFERNLSVDAEHRWNALVQFLDANRAFPSAYRQFHLERTCFGRESARDRLHAIFVAALTSNSAGGLRLSGRLARVFQRKLEPLGAAMIVTGDDFLGCLGARGPAGVFRWMTGLKGISHKKAALFMRDLALTQHQPALQIFDDGWINPSDLYIPLDVVIATVINRLFPPATFRREGDLGKHFLDLDRFARGRLGDDHMLLEDLWYWGFFCLRLPVSRKQKGQGKTAAQARPRGWIGPRQLQFNWDKYLVDSAFSHGQQVPAHFAQFLALVGEP